MSSLVLSGSFYSFSGQKTEALATMCTFPIIFCIQSQANREQREKNKGWFQPLGNKAVLERKGYLPEFWLLLASLQVVHTVTTMGLLGGVL